MKKIVLIAALALSASPAYAGLLSGANLLNVAKVVLQGRATLNQGQTSCGTSLALQPKESLLMQLAGTAVQKALPVAKYGVLDTVATKAAATASTSPTFCQTTAAKKPSILGSVADAAVKLGVGGGTLGGLGGLLGGAGGSLGGLGGLLGGATTGQTGTSTTDVIGSILGGATPK